MKDKKDDKLKIEESTYNWGPFLVKQKILEHFPEKILEQLKKKTSN